MTFEGGKIEVQQYICKKNKEITYDETLLENKNAIIIGSMTYFAPPDHESLKKIIPTEYHDFLDLFGEILAAELPRHDNSIIQSITYQGRKSYSALSIPCQNLRRRSYGNTWTGC